MDICIWKRLGGLARCAALVLAPVLVPALTQAQTRAALVKNVDEPGRAPYQSVIEFNAGTGCIGTQCNIVSFAPVPAGKRLVVDHVSALVGVISGGQPTVTAFSNSNCINCSNRALVTGWVNTGLALSGSVFWALDRATTVYFEAGEIPQLKMLASASFAFVGNASLVGHLIDATN